MMETVEGLERALRSAEINHLIVMLIDEDLIAPETGAKLYLELAEMVRSLEVSPDLQPYADMKAAHYEDSAHLILGGDDLLPRDDG